MLTPECSSAPILTLRNVRCAFWALLNMHQKWMSVQDPAELNPLQLTYKRKIWKYKMMVVKLQHETSDALEFCSKDHLNYLQGVETTKQQKLTENEKKDLIIRSA